MPDIDLGLVSPPEEPDPDLLTFGPERPGGGSPARRHRWLPARWLPARWQGRPVPRSVVAVVSAVVAGAAVAVYLDRPTDEPAPAAEPAPVLAPESWLDVTADAFPRPEEAGSDADRRRWEQATAGHPAEAVLVLPLALYQPRLTGLPPGTYQVRASCELGQLPEALPGPVRYRVSVQEPAGPQVSRATFRCDGQVRIAPERLTVDGYHAYFSGVAFPIEDPVENPAGPGPDFLVGNYDPVVVVSFTRV